MKVNRSAYASERQQRGSTYATKRQNTSGFGGQADPDNASGYSGQAGPFH